jgi:hypothetical protein
MTPSLTATQRGSVAPSSKLMRVRIDGSRAEVVGSSRLADSRMVTGSRDGMTWIQRQGRGPRRVLPVRSSVAWRCLHPREPGTHSAGYSMPSGTVVSDIAGLHSVRGT